MRPSIAYLLLFETFLVASVSRNVLGANTTMKGKTLEMHRPALLVTMADRQITFAHLMYKTLFFDQIVIFYFILYMYFYGTWYCTGIQVLVRPKKYL